MVNAKEKINPIGELLKPDIINSIEGLELISKIIVEEFFHGNNRSHKLGMGQEFHQYRSYEPGDDLRLLDWKMYARSERYYIRQSEIDTHITIRFIIDASRSMEHQSNGVKKIEMAKIITASLGYLARNQGDSFGLYSINDKRVNQLSPTIHPQQFLRLLKGLSQIESSSRWPLNNDFSANIVNRGRKEMLIFISDLYQEGTEITDFITFLKTSKTEVIVINLEGENEIDFGYDGFYTFKDLETGEEVITDAKKARLNYIQRKNESESFFKRLFLDREIEYYNFNTAVDIGKTLSSFLQLRKKLL